MSDVSRIILRLIKQQLHVLRYVIGLVTMFQPERLSAVSNVVTKLLFPTYIAAALGIHFLGRVCHMPFVEQEVQGATA